MFVFLKITKNNHLPVYTNTFIESLDTCLYETLTKHRLRHVLLGTYAMLLLPSGGVLRGLHPPPQISHRYRNNGLLCAFRKIK